MKIGIIANLNKDNASVVLNKVIDKLNALNVEVLLPQNCSFDDIVSNKTGTYLNVIENSDVIIAIGGDGTIIHTAKLAAIYSKAVLGINSGRTGYMAGIESDELDLLNKLIDGDYSIENRMMLSSVVSSNPDKIYYSLNDVVISKGSMDYAPDFSLFNSAKHFMNLRADGIIVSTPTGSTAYAMSAGGPVTDPSIECMIVVPICPISLYSKGFVLSAESKIDIKFKTRGNQNVFVTFDGRDGCTLTSDDTLTLSKADDVVTRLIKIKNDSFYDVLKNKISVI